MLGSAHAPAAKAGKFTPMTRGVKRKCVGPLVRPVGGTLISPGGRIESLLFVYPLLGGQRDFVRECIAAGRRPPGRRSSGGLTTLCMPGGHALGGLWHG